MGYKITFVSVILLLLAIVRVNAQCGSWNLTATGDISLCAASGKVTATLTGAEAVTNILYSLESVTPDGYSVSPNTSSTFENVPAGDYVVVVKGICNGEVLTKTTNVHVPGNYIPFTASVVEKRITLYNCNTGQGAVTVADGRLPYRVTITASPANYTGRTFFTVNDNFVIDSLWAGNYTLSITDACGATAAIQTLIITTSSAMLARYFYFDSPDLTGTNCNKFVIKSPNIYLGTPYYDYRESNTPLTYSVSYNGMPKSAYKLMKANATDTITLPDGETIGDTYGKTITYYIKTPCGEEVVAPYITPAPALYISHTINCLTDFDARFYVSPPEIICYPVHVAFRNTSTNTYRYDTIRDISAHFMTHLPFGTYKVTAVTKDGYSLPEETLTVNVPTTASPYYISKFHNRGDYGNDGAIAFILETSKGNLPGGTKISLISPSTYTYNYTIPPGYNSHNIQISESSNTSSPRYFYPGSYLFRVTDACGTYDIPVVVDEKDVYRYNLTYTTQQTCAGLKVTPSATSIYNNSSQPVYFKILSGPKDVVYDESTIETGGSLLLPLSGQYKIIVASNPYFMTEYGGGTGANIKTINFIYNPLIVDVNNSLGWICPGQPDNSGTIVAVAAGGSTAATGVYTYRIAAQGHGETGPFWATNTTGKFSTATSGGAYTLMKNENYDIRVVDECGAAAIQTIKIIDFETAQLASSDKLQYCVGDDVHFKIINLPTTAITYAWTGPDNFFSSEQNPILRDIKVTGEGNYHVVINSDICAQPIHGDVSITLAPYVVSCYSAVTDTSVNPYAFGLLGNWHVSRTYKYYGPRAESDPGKPTDIRHDGAFDDFISFWEVQNNKWKANKDTTRWVWNAQSTLFNAKGFELENSDPLGRYNAGIYGYGDAIPVAVVQNSRYREAAYEGFEDYGFEVGNCDAPCASDRRFDFSYYKNKIDSSQHHTGKYSIRVQPGDTVGIRSVVTGTVEVPGDPTFNMGNNACSQVPVLKSVRVDKATLLPAFSPIAGKKIVFSAWVKETQDCKCSTYVSNKITLAVGSTTIDVLPIGGIIEGWQRYEQVIDLPSGATGLSVVMLATGTATVYYDDIRIHPYSANMKSFVYDAQSLRMLAELDENNYATFYEYDDDGSLTRVKKETEQGIKTIKETRSALIKQ